MVLTQISKRLSGSSSDLGLTPKPHLRLYIFVQSDVNPQVSSSISGVDPAIRPVTVSRKVSCADRARPV